MHGWVIVDENGALVQLAMTAADEAPSVEAPLVAVPLTEWGAARASAVVSNG
jgi:hypothetical protein